MESRGIASVLRSVVPFSRSFAAKLRVVARWPRSPATKLRGDEATLRDDAIKSRYVEAKPRDGGTKPQGLVTFLPLIPAYPLLTSSDRRDKHPVPCPRTSTGPRLCGAPGTFCRVRQSFREDARGGGASRTEDAMKRIGTIQTSTAELTVSPGGGG